MLVIVPYQGFLKLLKSTTFAHMNTRFCPLYEASQFPKIRGRGCPGNCEHLPFPLPGSAISKQSPMLRLTTTHAIAFWFVDGRLTLFYNCIN